MGKKFINGKKDEHLMRCPFPMSQSALKGQLIFYIFNHFVLMLDRNALEMSFGPAQT